VILREIHSCMISFDGSVGKTRVATNEVLVLVALTRMASVHEIRLSRCIVDEVTQTKVLVMAAILADGLRSSLATKSTTTLTG
jgi:hypothetical protein